MTTTYTNALVESGFNLTGITSAYVSSKESKTFTTRNKTYIYTRKLSLCFISDRLKQATCGIIVG